MSESPSTAEYMSVVNHELQYSVWPAHKELPAGWAEVGERGPKDSCLDYIEQIWVDMKPTVIRIHLECLQRRGEVPIREKDDSQAPARVSGFKVTDTSGLPFADKHDSLRLAEGRTIEDRGNKGLHFSKTLEDAVANGVAAAAWDDRYFEELRDELLSSPKLHADGIRLFAVSAESAVQVGDSVYRADRLTVEREVDLSESRLWPLLSAYRAWQEGQRKGDDRPVVSTGSPS